MTDPNGAPAPPAMQDQAGPSNSPEHQNVNGHVPAQSASAGPQPPPPPPPVASQAPPPPPPHYAYAPPGAPYPPYAAYSFPHWAQPVDPAAAGAPPPPPPPGGVKRTFSIVDGTPEPGMSEPLQKRVRHCCKCGSNECKGKGGRAFCNNPCQDCGKLECKGRNSKRPDRTCADAWP